MCFFCPDDERVVVSIWELNLMCWLFYNDLFHSKQRNLMRKIYWCVHKVMTWFGGWDSYSSFINDFQFLFLVNSVAIFCCSFLPRSLHGTLDTFTHCALLSSYFSCRTHTHTLTQTHTPLCFYWYFFQRNLWFSVMQLYHYVYFFYSN